MELEFYAERFRDDPEIEALTESSADAAVETLRSTPVDCLVSDGVRTSDGELLVEVAAETVPGLRTLLYSGSPAIELPTDAVNAVDAYLRKGDRGDADTSTEALRGRVRELIDSAGEAARPASTDPDADADADWRERPAAGNGTDDGTWRRLDRFDWTDRDEVAVALVSALAAELDRDVTDLPPLYRAVDPEALGALVVGTGDGGATASLAVEFEYVGLSLRLAADGTVTYRRRSAAVDGGT